MNTGTDHYIQNAHRCTLLHSNARGKINGYILFTRAAKDISTKNIWTFPTRTKKWIYPIENVRQKTSPRRRYGFFQLNKNI